MRSDTGTMSVSSALPEIRVGPAEKPLSRVQQHGANATARPAPASPARPALARGSQNANARLSPSPGSPAYGNANAPGHSPSQQRLSVMKRLSRAHSMLEELFDPELLAQVESSERFACFMRDVDAATRLPNRTEQAAAAARADQNRMAELNFKHASRFYRKFLPPDSKEKSIPVSA